MEFPDNCIRGIPNDSFVRDGLIGTDLFHFKERDAREDGWAEQSVNWQDDDLAIEFSLAQRKENGELHFKAGVALVSRIELDRIRQKWVKLGVISYERQPLDGNLYHGNILLQASMIRSPLMKQIAAALALYAEYVPRVDSLE
jgi:hypothetical protein